MKSDKDEEAELDGVSECEANCSLDSNRMVVFIVLATSDRRIGGRGEETSLDEWELLSEWLHSSANIEAIGRGRHVSRP
jgi:hypothetical protein